MDILNLKVLNGIYEKAQWTNVRKHHTQVQRSIVDYLLTDALHLVDQHYGVRCSAHRDVSCEHLLVTAKLRITHSRQAVQIIPKRQPRAIKIVYDMQKADKFSHLLLQALSTKLIQNPFLSYLSVQTLMLNFLNSHCDPKQISTTQNVFRIKQEFRFDITVHGTEFYFKKQMLHTLRDLRFSSPSKYFTYIKNLTGLNRTRTTQQVDMEEVITLDGEVSDQVFEHWKKFFMSSFRAAPEIVGDAMIQSQVVFPSRSGLAKALEVLGFPITEQEVWSAIKRMKSRKAPGVDNVPAELLKVLSKKQRSPLIQCLVAVFAAIFTHEKLPQEWLRSVVVVIHKSGEPRNPANWRGITLNSTCRKAFSSIINERLTKFAETTKMLSECQFGFRQGRSTFDALFVFVSILNRFVLHSSIHNELLVCFIDLRKAYDTIQWPVLMCKLRRLGLGGKMEKIIQAMLQESTLQVKLGDFLTDPFSASCGLPQGDVISPLLFNLFVADITSHIRSAIPWTEADANLLTDHILFADDLLLLAKSQERLQSLVNCVRDYCESSALVINSTKTKVQAFSNFRNFKPTIILDGVELEVVQSFKYLGVTFQSNDKCSNVFDLHKQTVLKQTKTKLFQIISICRCVPVSEALDCFNTFARGHLEYAAGVLDYTRKEWNEAEKLQNLFARRLLGVNETTTTAAVLGELGIMTMKSRFDLLNMTFHKHIMKLPPSSLVRKAFDSDRLTSPLSLDAHVKQLFQYYGLNKSSSVEMMHRNIKSREEQNWHGKKNESDKLRSYRLIKYNLAFESYLEYGSEEKYEQMVGRRYLTKLRVGTNSLQIEVGRRRRRVVDGVQRSDPVPVEERLCLNCDSGSIEDEFHVLLHCPAFNEQRQEFVLRTKHVTDQKIQIGNMTVVEKQKYFMGCFGKNHRPKPVQQFQELKTFVYKLMQQHRKLDETRRSRSVPVQRQSDLDVVSDSDSEYVPAFSAPV